MSMSEALNYESFLTTRTQSAAMGGFDPVFMPDCLKDFQVYMTTYAVQKGRAAILEDCGLGKSVQELVWGENVSRYRNRPVLHLCPLAVTSQTIKEAEKFGIPATASPDGTVHPGINVTNYERLHLFNPSDFAGAVCDESSIIKAYDGARKTQITDFMRKMEFRLLATATAAPNSYTELGTASEALGYLPYFDMLSRFFKNDQNSSVSARNFKDGSRVRADINESAKWRLKGHATEAFWRWVCSWSRSLRKPSDLGFDDAGYTLPPLIEQQHLIDVRHNPPGMLFALPAVGLGEQRDERRRTIGERCEYAAHLAAQSDGPVIVWCDLNPEGDELERRIPDCVQISGRHDDDEKEALFGAFLNGTARVLVTKGKIGGWGLNFQHCHHQISFPTHSWESYYQRVRRSYRFGQDKPVTIDVVTTEGEKNILANLQRKAAAAEHMFAELVRYMNESINIERAAVRFDIEEELPSWL
jgi:hypothetical protein